MHINAGAAGLALAIVLGRRIGFKKHPTRPHNLPFVLLGAGLLWFGWFGFNAGSALGATDTAALALLNTQVATAAGLRRLAPRWSGSATATPPASVPRPAPSPVWSPSPPRARSSPRGPRS